MNTIEQLSPAQFRSLCGDSHCVIDVRNRDEFATGSHAPLCWPVSEIDGASAEEFLRAQGLATDTKLVLLCASGKRAQGAAEKLRALLPNPVAVVQGGRNALLAAGTGS
jgi:rhodanese-related sulfurtransferase